jgi:adenylate cyclase
MAKRAPTAFEASAIAIATWRRVEAHRWPRYLFLALLMTFVAWLLHVEYFDNLILDKCFLWRGAHTGREVASQLPYTNRFLLIELPHNVPRPLLAELITNLRQAKVVALDMMLGDREAELTAGDRPYYKKYNIVPQWRREDAQLAKALRVANNVILGSWSESISVPDARRPGAVQRRRVWQRPPDALWNAARYHAHFGVIPTYEDGIVRKVRLFDGPPQAPLPALGLVAAAAASQTSQIKANTLIRLDNRDILTLTVPDYQLPINYLGPRDCFEDDEVRMMYQNAMGDNFGPEQFQDSIVFIGQTDDKAKDILTTPFGDMPGVHVHMHIAATLRNPQGAPLPVAPRQTLLLSFGSALLVMMPLLRSRLGISFALLVFLVVGLFFLEANLFTTYNRYFPFSVPVFAMIFTYNAIALYEYGYARATLGRFIGQEMTGVVLSPIHKLGLGGRVEVATAFFCDLRNFSAASEKLTPELMTSLLNEYTALVTDIIQQHGGRPIDYFGDGIFSIFQGTPRRGPQLHRAPHPLRAMRAALAIQKIAALVLEKETQRPLPLEIGIGLATGPMLIGVVGSESHMKLGAVGDTVNIASRVQALSQICGFGVLCTTETHEAVKPQITMAPCGPQKIRGRDKEIDLFGACRLSSINRDLATDHGERKTGVNTQETLLIHTSS